IPMTSTCESHAFVRTDGGRGGVEFLCPVQICQTLLTPARGTQYVPIPMVGIDVVWIQGNGALEFAAGSLQVPLRPVINKPQAGVGFGRRWIELGRLGSGSKGARI